MIKIMMGKTCISVLFLVFCLTGLMACSDTQTLSGETQYKTIPIPIGGNAYLTQGASGSITTSGIADWHNNESEFTLFFKLDKPALTEIRLLTTNNSGDATIALEINDDVRTAYHTSGSAQPEPVSFGKFDLPGNTYIAAKLKGIEKTGHVFADVSHLILYLPQDINVSYVKDNQDNRFYWGRRGPSVHLRFEVPQNRDIKWFYSEITVPEGYDPPGSFFMANGFAEGYFGIQVNSVSERRVLFSVWSPFQTDNPAEIPDDLRIRTLAQGANVYVGEFGNEGSGGQSVLVYNWKAGITYHFLNSAKPDGDGNTIYTAYFFSPATQQWKLIASFLRPQTHTWYQRPHSFLESFLTRNGHLSRKAFYHNQWVMDTEGRWHELNYATFTGDDIARTGYRLDYDGGTENETFFLKNGGFFVGETPLDAMFTRSLANKQPDIEPEDFPF